MPIDWNDLFPSQKTVEQSQTAKLDWSELSDQNTQQTVKSPNLNKVYDELNKSLAEGTYKKSLDDLEKDPQFVKIASEFLKDIGQSSDDIYEYFRDEDFNLVKGFKRWADTAKFSDLNKKRYAYLRTAFDNASIGSFGQGMELLKDASLDIASDPTTLLGVLAGIFTGGTATAATFAAKQSAAQAAKTSLKNFAKSTIVPTPSNLKTTGQSFGRLLNLKDEAAQMLGTATMLGSYEGMLHAGLGDVARQGTQIVSNIKQSYSPIQTALMVPAGGAIGTVAPTGFTAVGKGASAFINKSMDVLGKNIGLENYQKKLLDDYKHKIDNYENEKFVRPEVTQQWFDFTKNLRRITGDKLGFLTFARMISPIRTFAKQSPTAKKLLFTFQKDEAQKYFELPELTEGLGFANEIEYLRSSIRQKLIDVVSPLVDDPTKFELTPDINEQLRNALIGKKVYGPNNTKIEKRVLDVAKSLRKLDNDIYSEAREAGLNVKYTKNHFPRFYNRETLEEKETLFINELITSGQVSPSRQDIIDLIKLRNEEDKFTVSFTNNEGVTSQKPFEKIMGQVTTEEQRIRLTGQFKEKYPEFIRDIERNKAEKVYKDMMELAVVDTTYDISTGGRGNFGSRAFEKISDDFLLENGFIDSDVMRAFDDYILKSIPVIVRTKQLGYNLTEFEDKFINRIKDELQYKLDDDGNILLDAKGTPILRDKPLKLSQKDDKYFKDLYMYATGKGLGPSGAFVDHLQLLNATAYLPLATVSSLTEMAIPFARANTVQYLSEAGRPIKELSDLMVNQLKDTVSQQQEALRKLGLGNDEIQRELRIFGYAFQESAKERAASLGGELTNRKLFGVGPELTTLQDGFYKLNLLRDWTGSVERTSFLIGKNIIRDAARDLADGGLKPKDELRLREVLVELGINPEDAIKWHKAGAKKYTSDVEGLKSYELLQDGRAYDPFYKKVLIGGSRFTNEVILNPSSASGLKPRLYSHPQAKLLFQFLSYPAAFTNTVLKKGIQRTTRSFSRGDVKNPGKLFSTFAIMTASAMYLNNLRTGGQHFEEDDVDQIFMDGVSRTGITGIADTVRRVATNVQYGGRGLPVVLAKAIGGPTVSDAIEMAQFNRGILETLSRKVPVVNQLLRTGIAGEEAKEIPKLLQDAARELDKKSYESLVEILEAAGIIPETLEGVPRLTAPESLTEPRKIEPRVPRERGGIVPDVPNVSLEPEDTKMRGYPFTYKDVAGFIVEDQEDRIGLADGGIVEDIQVGIFQKILRQFLRSGLQETTHTEFQHLYEHASSYLDSVQLGQYEQDKLKAVPLSIANKNTSSSKVNQELYLNYTGDNIQDILTDQYFNVDQVGIKLSTEPLVDNPYKVKVAIQNILDISKFNTDFNLQEIYQNEELVNFLEDIAIERSHEFMDVRLELEGLLKDFLRVERKLDDEDINISDIDLLLSSFNNQLFELIEKMGYDAIKISNGYLINNINKLFVTGKSRLKKAEGGPISRLIEFGGKMFGIGGPEQRQNEKEAAALINRAVDAKLIPDRERVPTDDYGFVAGKTGDTFNAANHALLSYKYGDTFLRRTGLQGKEILQALQGRAKDSALDALNNRYGMELRTRVKTQEEAEEAIMNALSNTYKTLQEGKKLSPGKNLYLTFEDV
jgi:hypothetical protein